MDQAINEGRLDDFWSTWSTATEDAITKHHMSSKITRVTLPSCHRAACTCKKRSKRGHVDIAPRWQDTYKARDNDMWSKHTTSAQETPTSWVNLLKNLQRAIKKTSIITSKAPFKANTAGENNKPPNELLDHAPIKQPSGASGIPSQTVSILDKRRKCTATMAFAPNATDSISRRVMPSRRGQRNARAANKSRRRNQPEWRHWGRSSSSVSQPRSLKNLHSKKPSKARKHIGNQGVWDNYRLLDTSQTSTRQSDRSKQRWTRRRQQATRPCPSAKRIRAGQKQIAM